MKPYYIVTFHRPEFSSCIGIFSSSSEAEKSIEKYVEENQSCVMRVRENGDIDYTFYETGRQISIEVKMLNIASNIPDL